MYDLSPRKGRKTVWDKRNISRDDGKDFSQREENKGIYKTRDY